MYLITCWYYVDLLLLFYWEKLFYFFLLIPRFVFAICPLFDVQNFATSLFFVWKVSANFKTGPTRIYLTYNLYGLIYATTNLVEGKRNFQNQILAIFTSNNKLLTVLTFYSYFYKKKTKFYSVTVSQLVIIILYIQQ